jgi:hypothetical protein
VTAAKAKDWQSERLVKAGVGEGREKIKQPQDAYTYNARPRQASRRIERKSPESMTFLATNERAS